MPLYDYECTSCHHVFELKQSFRDDPVGICPECKSSARRKFHAVPIIYKGSGFYTTDYARSGVRANGTSGNDPDKDTAEEKKTDAGKNDASKNDASKNDTTKSDAGKNDKTETTSKTSSSTD
ncbi:hypothetical protein FIM12_04770 [SAR202 cluster bacterium AD-804-J14_MRT_500m]|nr:hypothetical protein [SAR202 cluster bacterium AD-804-J14_MRT_500m]